MAAAVHLPSRTGIFLQHWQCTARVKNSQLLYPLFVGALEERRQWRWCLHGHLEYCETQRQERPDTHVGEATMQ